MTGVQTCALPISPRASIPDRKSRPSLLDAVSGLTKREPQFASYYAALGSKGFEADGDAWSHRAVVARGIREATGLEPVDVMVHVDDVFT